MKLISIQFIDTVNKGNRTQHSSLAGFKKKMPVQKIMVKISFISVFYMPPDIISFNSQSKAIHPYSQMQIQYKNFDGELSSKVVDCLQKLCQ